MPSNKTPKGIILYALSIVVISVSVLVYGCIKEESTDHFVGSSTITSELLTKSNDEEIKQEELAYGELPLENKLKEDQEKDRLIAAKKAYEKKKKEEAERKRIEEERRKAEEANKREEKKREEEEANRKQVAKAETDQNEPKKSDANTVVYEVTQYTAGYESTQRRKGEPGYGITASGAHVQEGITIACAPELPFGTEIYIPSLGNTYTCQDRGSLVTSGKIDIYTNSLPGARKFGRQQLEVQILNR